MKGAGLVDPITGFRRLFLLITPNETSFETLPEVPDYVGESIPYFMAFIILEFIISVIKKVRKARLNDSITSINLGIFQQVSKLIGFSVELSGYIWIHNNYQIWVLPWDSPVTWILCFLGVELAYYWVHRTGHEVNLFWAAHQTHHSSEDYNLTTALRQSSIHSFFSWLFYLPLAPFIPPTIFLVHHQFNLIYQFWIHTEVVGKMGFLEYIFNTPSHHRVHHGRNAYCIDKNYGGTLIIFDRLFGTFQKEEEEVVYGLVEPVTTFDAPSLQFDYIIYVIKKALSYKDFFIFWKVLFFPPGWEPGLPRKFVSTFPDVKPEIVYDPKVSSWLNRYCAVHFLINLGLYLAVQSRKEHFSQIEIIVAGIILILSLTSLGNLMDPKRSSYGYKLELVRCFILATIFGLYHTWFESFRWLQLLLEALFVGSFTGCLFQLIFGRKEKEV